ncbi:MAG: amino acid ABC transporter substrate-binding protein [Betaproteobacteria bacterium]|nr:amino acid ABC transporter substrate-binding protein [Betaproteobacteria bacterium]
MIRTAAACVVAAASLGLSGIAQAQAPIRIGASLSLTGNFAELGQTFDRGYRVCVQQANARGGVLGRKIALTVEDDKSEPATAAAIYEKLITKDKVDAVFSPYSSGITDGMADVTERHRMPMVAAGAATRSIYKKGRKFIFMVFTPAEAYLEGLVDVAAKRGLKTIAVIYEDSIFHTAIAQGMIDLAKRRGLQVVVAEAYPVKTTDFSALLNKIKAANPDVVAATSYFNDAVAIVRQMKEAGVDPRMAGVTAGGDLPKFYEVLGKSAEFVYGASQWEPDLVKLRAGGVIPIASSYPGAREFVEDHEKQFPGADMSYQSAAAFGGCQILLDSIRRAGSLDRDKVRAEILKFDGNTAFGAFRVDAEGIQIAHKMLTFQWQDGKKAIIWPEAIAPAAARFPTPPWSKRP